MNLLAAGADIPAWGGLAVSVIVAAAGGLVFLIKVVSRPGDDGALVARLDKRIDELEDELDTERQGRAQDNRDHADLVERMREEHRREMQKLREDMADLHTAYEVFKAQAQGRWPNTHPNGSI